ALRERRSQRHISGIGRIVADQQRDVQSLPGLNADFGFRQQPREVFKVVSLPEFSIKGPRPSQLERQTVAPLGLITTNRRVKNGGWVDTFEDVPGCRGLRQGF